MTMLAFVLLAIGGGDWRRPVPGPVARPFAYSAAEPFLAGLHRGVDLAARPGTRVRAACSGRVVNARGDVVTVRCGDWRVTHLPLAAIAVGRGRDVMAGTPLGTLGSSRGHTGLHLGVRRAGDAFGYVDPLALFGRTTPPATVPAPRRVRPWRAPPIRTGPGDPVSALRSAGAVGAARPADPVGSPRTADPFRGTPRVAPPARVRVSAPGGGGALAPWPAWAGLAVLLAGAAGGGVRIGVRRRRAALSRAVPSAP